MTNFEKIYFKKRELETENEILDDVDTFLSGLSYSYEIYSIIEELKLVIDGRKYSTKASDIIFTVFTFLIMKYGDYGTSPRSGWLDDKQKKVVLEYLDVYKEYEKVCEEMRGE